MNPTLELLLTRRSAKAIDMVEPGPGDQELDTIVRCGIRVPRRQTEGPIPPSHNKGRRS